MCRSMSRQHLYGITAQERVEQPTFDHQKGQFKLIDNGHVG